jgi:hypothetical protein
MSELRWIVLLALPLLLIFFGKGLLAWWDHRRIREYIANRGGRVVDISWDPFRSSSPDKHREDVYTVIFQTPEGLTQTIFCRTGLGGGVFLADRSDEPLAMDLQGPGRVLAEKARQRRDEPAEPRDDPSTAGGEVPPPTPGPP